MVKAKAFAELYSGMMANVFIRTLEGHVSACCVDIFPLRRLALTLTASATAAASCLKQESKLFHASSLSVSAAACLEH